MAEPRGIRKLDTNFLNIALGAEEGYSNNNVFGLNPSIDSPDTLDIWDGGALAGGLDYTFSPVPEEIFIVSEDDTDDQEYDVFGLDENFNPITRTVDCNGQTKVTVSASTLFSRINSAVNKNSSSNVGRVFVFGNGTVTAGTPDVLSLVRGVIEPGENTTLSSIFTVPAGSAGMILSWYASIASATADAISVARLRTREFGKVFQTKEILTLSTAGTSYLKQDLDTPLKVPEKTDILVRASSNKAGLAVAAGFYVTLVKNNLFQ